MARERKALYLRGMSGDIVREAKIEALRRGITLAGLVEQALAEMLGGRPEEELSEELQAEARWFHAHREELFDSFAGQYVAVRGQAVVDHDEDFDRLARRVFGRWGAGPVLMPKVTSRERTVRLPSPRVARP